MFTQPQAWADAGLDPQDVKSVLVVPVAGPQPDDPYRVTLLAQTDPDSDEAVHLATLAGDQPMQYAAGCLAQALRARHEQGMFAQLTQTLKMTPQMAGPLMVAMRERRPALDDEHTWPMRFEPILAKSDLEGKLMISLHGQRMGQWTVAEGIGHAQAVLMCAAICTLDSTYYAILRDQGQVGLDEQHARLVVATLSHEMGADPAG